MSRILFPDLSDYQPNVNLTTLTRHLRNEYGIAMVALKATEGTEFTSSRFRSRWLQLEHLAEVRMAYHFAHVNQGPAKVQAEHFWNVVHAAGARKKSTRGKADLLCLDAEDGSGSPKSCRKWMGDFLAHLDSLSKLRPAWIYGGEWFRSHCSGGKIDRYIWAPAYGPEPVWPKQFAKRLQVAWQFTDGQYGPGPHVVPGVGVSDLSWFLGDVKRLKSVAGVR